MAPSFIAEGFPTQNGPQLFHRRLWDELPRLEVVYTDTHYTAHYLDEEVFDLAPFRRMVVSRPEGYVLSGCPAPACVGTGEGAGEEQGRPAS
jgi:hypothetical protein